MNKISARVIWFLIALFFIAIGLAEIAIMGKVHVNTPLRLFVLELIQLLDIPSSNKFFWFFPIAVCINTLFLVCLWQLTCSSLRPQWMWVLLTVQLLIALLCMSELVLVLSAELVVLLTWSRAWKCLVLQMSLCAFVEYYFFARNGAHADLAMLVPSMVFQVLPFIGGYLVVREKRTRLKLLAALRELEAKQALMMESIREEERLDVEAKLHDVIGNQLAALNGHLEMALRHTQEKRSKVP